MVKKVQSTRDDGPSTANVRIKGISALLMHRYPMEPIEAIDKKPIETQAEISAYRDANGVLFVPAINLQRSLIAAAVYSSGKGRASLQKNAAACLQIMPENLSLGVEDYEIDARPVVIPSTRGRIIRYRPRLTEWSLDFELEWDNTLITETQARKIVDDAGRRVGLLDFRPEKKGPFGRFMVTEWIV